MKNELSYDPNIVIYLPEAKLVDTLNKEHPLIVAHVQEMLAHKEQQIQSAIDDLKIAFKESDGFNKIHNPIFRALFVLGYKDFEELTNQPKE